MSALVIRLEESADQAAVWEVNRRAFDSEAEADLVDRLREGGYARISLVAEREGAIIGHILFSDLPITTETGVVASLALAPMAVVPEFQRRGIGSQLVQRGLDVCREQGHRIVIVLGHPEFYPRFGFSADLARPLKAPFSGDAWMALELVPGALSGVKGEVHYPPPFGIDAEK